VKIAPLEFTERRIKARRAYDVIPAGIDMAFEWGLAGPNGAHFTLLAEPWHTTNDIKKAKAYLRNNRDVVSIDVVHSK